MAASREFPEPAMGTTIDRPSLYLTPHFQHWGNVLAAEDGDLFILTYSISSYDISRNDIGDFQLVSVI